ncbi:MAG: KEOPS complex kinase/ATPase Bud32 [Candidatus Thalassarchaeaceae archaeon]|jgi:Kae1-associated kinase Bud32|tara:strand:- start:206 stop:880 length:675 start_codon:yes stop_codon:yes gene_type:complete
MDESAIPFWFEDSLLHIGAEATAISGSWMGLDAVLKKREPRAYRHPSLDKKLTRQRLAAEARILSRLQRIDFPSPCLFDVDSEGGWILISRIDGVPLYEALQNGNAGLNEIKKFGELIRKLHEADVSHGDLTTHNVLYDKAGNLSLIDFGLARISPEIEQLGLDLQVLNECLTASHYEIDSAVEVMIEGYLSGDSGQTKALVNISAEEVIERFNAIRGRVRYHA